MEKKNMPCRKGISQGFKPLNTSSRKVTENELCETFEKLEHRVEVLTSITRDQEVSEYFGSQEAYLNYAAEAKAYAQLIRSLLDLGREGEVG